MSMMNTSECTLPHENLVLTDNLTYYNLDFGNTTLCRAQVVKRVHLGNLGFVEVDPTRIPDRVMYLNLTRNLLTELPELTSRVLKELDLFGNQLTRLENKTLPDSLRILYLSRNNIKVVRGVDFSQLDKLDLSKNPVESFELSQTNLDKWNDHDSDSGVVFQIDTIIGSCDNGAKRANLSATNLAGVSEEFPVCVLPDDQWQKLYNHEETNGSEYGGANHSKGSSRSTGVIVGIVIGCCAVLALVVGVLVWRRIRRQVMTKSTMDFSLMTNENASDTTVGALLKDQTIFSARIPMKLIKTKTRIGKGAYGEVFRGTYEEREVAIKRLCPLHRRSIKHIEGLLLEVKLMASLEHTSIVQFIGVAWNALTDLCLIVEFMTGGDLRGLLVQYEKDGRPHGFDHDKLRIAKEIANGLTYLHSLEPKVLHRDLKSSNVLLSDLLEAKLTDFGISRETSDQTMTAGIGTSLWMAPEVMMGIHYDEKADMFSFGVVLSELDTHRYPYESRMVDANGRGLPEAALLQQVAEGKIRADFSDGTAPEVLSIAHRCLTFEPEERPSAAEVAYELQKIILQKT